MTALSREDTAVGLSGAALWWRLGVSVLLAPVGWVMLVFNTSVFGSPGGAGEARAVAWWLEPFHQLRQRRTHR